ncbi:MAG TPA: urease accessory protein UreD [Xanthobacteraceae bacterium]|jgi:urease accessory protein|nr:urease accessory protein UreD [Xanthobacteraceae bacterium]
MSVVATLRSETFAANRARARIAFGVNADAGVSRRTRVHEAGSLRVRFPNGLRADTLDAVMVNTAGGMTGGDRFDVAIDVGAGAKLTVTTAAAEKIYRSLGPDTEIAVKLSVSSGGTLAWLPQETILFNQVRLKRSIDVTLDDDAQLLVAEAVVFGRSAMAETVTQGLFVDRWRIHRGGALVFAETARLDTMIAKTLAQSASTAGGVAIASVIKTPGTDDDVAGVRALTESFVGEVGISAWNGIAVARFVARDGATLRRDLMNVLAVLSPAPLPRLWLN